MTRRDRLASVFAVLTVLLASTGAHAQGDGAVLGTILLDLRASREGKVSVILDAMGQPIGTVAVAENVTIMQSSRSHVYALERDEFGLASVVRYRIQ